MKRIFLLLSTSTVLFIACNTQTEKTKAETKKDTLAIAVESPVIKDSTRDEQAVIEKYENNKGEKITARYVNDGKETYVMLQKDTLAEIKLLQKIAWAKGAEYTDGTTFWNANGDNATFIQDGRSVKFRVKK